MGKNQYQWIIHYRNTTTDFVEWYFYRVSEKKENLTPEKNSTENKQLHVPALLTTEIDAFIKQTKSQIEELPKLDENSFSYTELETRKLYARAYERWTPKEIKIMNWAYNTFQRIDKVAQLLKRQPSAVERKMKEISKKKR